tara:strand:+ start:6228 stop:6821 length:594 start_codon:yes stop_codon:yes gene_type:complete
MSKRNLREAVAMIEVGISKCLGGGRLSPVELDEMRHVTYADLMTEYGLDSLMAEKVKVHVQQEIQREKFQSLQTWKPESRDLSRDYPLQATPTNPIREAVDILDDLEDITDMNVSDSHQGDDGRMLDYGHVKSDSHEGRMMRQALYEMAEYSNQLHAMLSDDDDLPQWCHYKIAVARACVGKVKHYLEYKIKHPKQK